MATEAQWTVLADYCNRALDGQAPEVADRVRAQLLADEFRVIAVFDVDDDSGEPIPASLGYRVDVPAADGWAPLARVHWSRLPGIGDAEVRRELANYQAQRDMGITVDSWAGEDPV